MEKSERVSLSSLEATRLENMTNMFAKFKEEFGYMPCDEQNIKGNEKDVKKRKSRTPRCKLNPTRRSLRISKERPKELASLDKEDEDDENFVVKKKNSTPRISIQPRELINIEDITDDIINSIWYKSSGKTYSPFGSTCHQCRQKTIDTKSYCWSKTCIGVRGQFCGFCLEKRYGEDVAVALKDPSWICPPCRGICNCSICRTREGKLPTGILAPYMESDGFKSVREFLESKEKAVLDVLK